MRRLLVFASAVLMSFVSVSAFADTLSACKPEDYARIRTFIEDPKTRIAPEYVQPAARLLDLLQEESLATTCSSVIYDEPQMTIPGVRAYTYEIKDPATGTFIVDLSEDSINGRNSVSVQLFR